MKEVFKMNELLKRIEKDLNNSGTELFNVDFEDNRQISNFEEYYSELTADEVLELAEEIIDDITFSDIEFLKEDTRSSKDDDVYQISFSVFDANDEMFNLTDFELSNEDVYNLVEFKNDTKILEFDSVGSDLYNVLADKFLNEK